MKSVNGYFDEELREFVLTDMHPIRPWRNCLWNEQIVANIDQFGFGVSQGKGEAGFRNLIVGERLIYVKEGDSIVAMNRNYGDLPFSVFETHVGIGYQRIIGEYRGIRVEFTILIPQNGYVEIHDIKVTNLSKKERKFTLCYFAHPLVNLTWHPAYTLGEYVKEEGSLLFSHDGYAIPEKNRFVAFHSSLTPDSYAMSFIDFKGEYNELSSPLGLRQGLPCRSITFEGELASAFGYELTLKPSESKEIVVAGAFGESKKDVLDITRRYASIPAYQEELFAQIEEGKKNEGMLLLNSPNEYLNSLMNVWLKRQISLGKTWGRIYGKGFRDLMQDVAGFLSLDPKKGRERILSTLAYQRIDGNTLRQFDPIDEYPYQDGASWIPASVLAYLKETSDFSLLEELVPYYQSPIRESVFDHMRRGIDYLLAHRGEHQLVLWGGGDWNDSLNACGLEGKGESVWLSLATYKAGNEFLEIAQKAHKSIDFNGYKAELNELKSAIVTHGWENDHFIYGYNDEGRKIGSSTSSEGKIFLNPQTWAVLAKVAELPVLEQAMDSVESHLSCSFGYVQLSPSFRHGDPRVGRASYFLPGTYENGSVYNHGVAFKIAADYMLGRDEMAYDTLLRLLPGNHPESGMEPYAIGNMYLGPECVSRVGYSPMAWITGTAGWVYRTVNEGMLGILPDYDGLVLAPRLPKDWGEVEVKRIYQGKAFRITLVHTGKQKLIVSGVETPGNKVFLPEGDEVSVRYEY